MNEAEEFERIMQSLERYQQMDEDEIDPDEYEQVYNRWAELRRAGHGPQPHHLDDYP
jgi:Asp-tRNA(Asn)/Glu-tRNA(Gln) amidotransferase C subunit